MAEPEKKALSQDEIKFLLSKKRPKGLSTEPRTTTVWFKQNHFMRNPDGCDNPNCVDKRPTTDRGKYIVVQIGDKFCCRSCFLAGWLSTTTPDMTADATERT